MSKLKVEKLCQEKVSNFLEEVLTEFKNENEKEQVLLALRKTHPHLKEIIELCNFTGSNSIN